MAYDFLIALIKNVEGILLEPDHQMVPVIRNRNGDKHQIHINLERGAAAVGWPNVSRRRVLDNSWFDVDVPLTVLTETDRKSSREAECLCKKARHLQRKLVGYRCVCLAQNKTVLEQHVPSRSVFFYRLFLAENLPFQEKAGGEASVICSSSSRLAVKS